MARQRLVAAVLILAALAALAPPQATAGPAGQKGLRPLRLITFNVDPATVAAQARGYFAAEGLAVEITETPNSTDQMRGLAQGTWDMASTGFDNVLAWSGRDGGPEIVGVLQPNTGTMLPLYVRPEIQDWSDLKGKPLAVDAVDTQFALVLRRILLAHELDYARGDYDLVAIGTTSLRLESMARGETFAAIMSTELEARAQALGMRRIADHREVLPDYSPGAIAVARPWGEQHRDEIVRFIRAWLAGRRWVQANPAAAAELVMSQRNTNRAVAVQVVENLSPDGALNPPGLAGVLSLRMGFEMTPPLGGEIARYYDASYYQQAAQGR
jgi:ABC-type nitrate/sulfonate/bicarbonate transport system substrate-binding protein